MCAALHAAQASSGSERKAPSFAKYRGFHARAFRQILADFLGDIWHCRRASARWCRRTTSVHIASFFGEMGILRSTACAVPGALSLCRARTLAVGMRSPGCWPPPLLLGPGAGVWSSGFSSAVCAGSGGSADVAKTLAVHPWQAASATFRTPGSVCWPNSGIDQDWGASTGTGRVAKTGDLSRDIPPAGATTTSVRTDGVL